MAMTTVNLIGYTVLGRVSRSEARLRRNRGVYLKKIESVYRIDLCASLQYLLSRKSGRAYPSSLIENRSFSGESSLRKQ